jgi:hypothetical protein
MRNVVIPAKGKAKINCKGAFNHYKDNAKHRNKENTYRLTDYNKIVRSFYTKVARDLVNNEGGVFIRNLGYFTILKNPRKSVVKTPHNGGKTYFNPNTDNHVYFPVFFGVGKNKPLLHLWVMDRAFSKLHVKNPLHKALISGRKYKTYISTLSSLYLLKGLKNDYRRINS